jgi:hypothetical protein
MLVVLLLEDGQAERAREALVRIRASTLGEHSKAAILGGLLLATRMSDQENVQRFVELSLMYYPDSFQGLQARLTSVPDDQPLQRLQYLSGFCRFLDQQEHGDVTSFRALLQHDLSKAAAKGHVELPETIKKLTSLCTTLIKWDTLLNPRVWSYLEARPALPASSALPQEEAADLVQSMIAWDHVDAGRRVATTNLLVADARLQALNHELLGDLNIADGEYADATNSYLRCLETYERHTLPWQRAFLGSVRGRRRSLLDGSQGNRPRWMWFCVQSAGTR